ncbi:MAG: hypothetical protein K2W95_15380 [Candidatus Obscuribacterales bacterium]|nr:hypothetical protein [Candidatus Obscuribacterales bacterium]
MVTTRNVLLVSWTGSILDELCNNNNLRWKTTTVPVTVFYADQPAVAAVLNLYDKAEGFNRLYKVHETRLAFVEAMDLAREEGLQFMEALIRAQYGLSLMNKDLVIAALKEAAANCQQSISEWQDRLIYMRAKPETAAPILDPQQELLEVILQNLEQYELVKASDLLRTRRRVIEDLLGEQAFDRAEYYAQSALKEAHAYGRRHWWTGIMLSLLARSQVHQRKFTEALAHMDVAERILHEWVLDSQSVLASEMSQLASLRKAALNPLP